MKSPLLERLERWMGASIANRILAAALTVATVALTLTGLMSYSFSRHLLQRQIEQEHAATAALLTQRLELRLNQIGEEMRALASNTLAVNALLDSAGRDGYLLPFLREFHTASLAPAALCLHDFRGHALACNRPEHELTLSDPAWHHQVMGENRHHTAWLPDGQGLLLALPVFYPGTGQPEGMIVARFSLEQLFSDIFALAGERTARITSDGKNLLACARCSDPPAALLLTRNTLALASPFDGLHLDLWVGEPRNAAFASLTQLTYSYLILAVLILLVVFFAARTIARRITQPLAILSRNAEQVAQNIHHELNTATTGADELGQLSASFRHMLQSLRSAHAELEQRVEERTAALRAQRNDYQVIFDSVPAFIWYFDRNGRVLRANQRAADFLGLRISQLLGKTIFELFPADFAARCQTSNLEVINTGREQVNLVEPLLQPDGALLWLRLDKAPFCDASGAISGVVVFSSDISAEIKAQEHTRLTAKVFDNTLEGIVITDAEMHIVAVNRAFCRITGYEQHEVLGRSARLLASGAQGHVFYRNFWRTIRRQGEWRGELWNRRKGGQVFAEYLSVSTVRDNRGRITHYVGVFSDITTLKRTEQRLAQMAYYDPLTNLPNRALFTERLQQSLTKRKRDPSPLGVMFIDLDRFKTINDTLGHEAGDQLLQQVAKKLRDCLREQDTVARLGGDEFIVLLEKPGDERHVARIAERMLKALARPFHFCGQEVFSGASIGIAMYPADGTDLETLLKNADTAMYRAKNTGRNQYLFYQAEMNAASHARLRLESELRRALRENEFTLLFQPQIDIASGHISGAEVLVRWNHPERGLLPPAEFLAIAEESGAIIDIDRWVLRTACNHYLGWRKEGLKGIHLAVNLSGRHILQRKLSKEIRDILGEHSLPGDWLELEFTETSLIQDSEDVRGTLQDIRSLGVRIAIDDFGTGYSSLLYLKRFPIDVLKIDQSFVRGLPDNAEDISIIDAILAMASRLKLQVVAEGVEQAGQAGYLHANGCPQAQGYYYGRPMAAADFANLYRGQLH
ncbi:EAL domain-containing protein [Sulfurivermis fontis]|uniref:bifunctional diguanylate cyclase/phosphodiesterase n=1 Tax=Sulfurivermis fontis TaxID=1972068 RepID=UPI000FDA2FF9|nr:EAL domain-containing protein [Sulfurivermis fontis]